MSTHDPHSTPDPSLAYGRMPSSAQQPGYRAPASAGDGGYGDPGTYGPDPKRVGTQPGKHVGFGEAIKRMYSKYAQFSGRAGRSEYWWVQLFVGVVYVGLSILAGTVGSTPSGEPNALGTLAGLLLLAFMLGHIVPLIALVVRRLHDVNLSGWFYLLVLIPFVGGLVVLVFTLLPAKVEGARFDR